MTDRPHLTHGLERARLLLRHNRLAELTFDDLSAAERAVVRGELDEKLRHARRRVRRAHAMGALLVAGFVVAAAAAFYLGPLLHVGPSGVRVTDGALEAEAWIIGVTAAGFGLGATDYLVRRRRRLTRALEKETALIAAVIARAG
ncbi:MAG TPA: hypothetical protein VG916_06435 [Gemmatimonadaceae bacterium]|nr:hypothetical protein [Gemmatimonadaceae bacterium]